MLALHETNTRLPAHTLFTPTHIGVNQRANAILSRRFNALWFQGNHNLYNLLFLVFGCHIIYLLLLLPGLSFLIQSSRVYKNTARRGER